MGTTGLELTSEGGVRDEGVDGIGLARISAVPPAVRLLVVSVHDDDVLVWYATM